MKMTVVAQLVVAASLLGALARGQTLERAPYLQLGSQDAMTIRWRTDQPTDSKVWFGPTPWALTATATTTALTAEHELRVTGLEPDTRYYYAVGFGSTMLTTPASDRYFKTSPVPGKATPTRVWVVGDSGSASVDAQAVRDAYLAFNGGLDTDLWLMLGDNAYPQGTDLQYQIAFFDHYAELLENTVSWSTLGNHDAISADSATQTGVYYDIFSLPTAAEAGGVPSGTEAYYSFDHGNIHFICLDSEESDRTPAGAMLTWVQADLAANTQPWVIAFWHHPPYTKGSHNSDTEGRLIDMRMNAVPILESYGVDLVLSGHSHCYERSMLIDGHYGPSMTFTPAMARDAGDGKVDGDGAYAKTELQASAHEGTVYSVVGASGLTSGGTFDHPVHVVSFPILGSMVIDINGDQLDARYLNSDGIVLDYFTIVKGGATPVDANHIPVQPFASWKYHDQGIDLGHEWSQPGYDDSTWASGIGSLGYGETYIATELSFGPDPDRKHNTTYFRGTFELVGDPALVTGFQIALNYDDGVVAYVNGREAFRTVMPSGPIRFGTPATTSHEAGVFEIFNLGDTVPYLVEGTNTVAFEVHQFNSASSDLVFDAAVGYQAFVPFLGPVAVGAVGTTAGTGPIDVLRINGSAGGFGRSVDVAMNDPIVFSVDAPPTLAAAAFSLFGFQGMPGPAELTSLPAVVGELCFGLPAGPATPNIFFVANSLGSGGGPLIPSTPAPWSGAVPVALLGSCSVFTFQGFIAVDAAGTLEATNAVRLNLLP